jgi:peptidoglycan hydrolase-like protein with peptidoglycan-binding domain
MPGAVFKPVPYRAEAGRFAQAPIGWVPHVVVGNGSPYQTFATAISPKRRFAHFWVSKTGVIEQYAETYYKSWAQADGNSLYWAVETEGFPEEPYTDAQLASLAKIHAFLEAPDKIANSPGQPGVGTHYMGGAAWGGHSCPDPQGKEGSGPRSKARADIIARANATNPPPAKPGPTPAPAPKPVAPASKGLNVNTIDLRNAGTTLVKGAGIKPLQRLLGVTADGLAGSGTRAALIAAQKRCGLTADAIFGPATAEALLAGK